LSVVSKSVTSTCPAPAPQSISESPITSLGKVNSAFPVPSVKNVNDVMSAEPRVNPTAPVASNIPEEVIVPEEVIAPTTSKATEGFVVPMPTREF